MTIQDAFESMDYQPALEGRAEADAWLAARDHRLRPFIAGEFREPTAGGWFDSLNPATNYVLA